MFDFWSVYSGERIRASWPSCFPFGTKGGIWDMIVIIPDHCLSIYVSLFGCLELDTCLFFTIGVQLVVFFCSSVSVVLLIPQRPPGDSTR